MIQAIELKLKNLLQKAGVTGEILFSQPPKPEMGDLAFACFDIAKREGKNPVEMAKEIKSAFAKASADKQKLQIVDRVEAFGPYVNFWLNAGEVAELVLDEVNKKDFGKGKFGKGKKVMVEFAHPNTHKPVHIGHLRNMITGESLVRIMENFGYKVTRANYQGDVGLHIAKCLWGIFQSEDYKSKVKSIKGVGERAKFLGQAYAVGGQAYEKDEKAKKEIGELNEKIYQQDKLVKSLYKLTRKWSLEYFAYIYKKVGVRKFDRLYFESETFELGRKIVLDGVKNSIFVESQGAIIFEGSKHGLHDRVFINNKGLPTYEAKDQALARMQFEEYNPDEIIHVVAKEQTEYFKVIFKALEFTFPKSKDREKHLIYGWVTLKEGKMSSRTGQVVLAEWLIDEVENKISAVMLERDLKNKQEIIKKVSLAAIKYSILRTGIGNDIVFDFNESISLTGNSGPYLLYVVTRINSLLKKSKVHKVCKVHKVLDKLATNEEKKLLLLLGEYGEIVEKAMKNYNPSVIAKYCFDVAQAFNDFYNKHSVLSAENSDLVKARLALCGAVRKVLVDALGLLTIETVDEM